MVGNMRNMEKVPPHLSHTTSCKAKKFKVFPFVILTLVNGTSCPILHSIFDLPKTFSWIRELVLYRRFTPIHRYVILIWAAPIPGDRWHCSLWP